MTFTTARPLTIDPFKTFAPPTLFEAYASRVPVAFAAAAALTLAVLPFVAPQRLAVEAWSPLPGVIAAVWLFAVARGGSVPRVVRRVAMLPPIVVLSAEIAFFAANLSIYDASAAASFVRGLQDQRRPVAYTRDYEGEFHFLGRLSAPLEVIGQSDSAAAEWAHRNPDGFLVRYGDSPPPQAVYSQRFRGGWLSIEAASP
jgi:hypothetical protein